MPFPVFFLPFSKNYLLLVKDTLHINMIFLQIGFSLSRGSLYARKGSAEWAPCSHFANFFATSMMMRTKRNPMRKIFLRDHDLETWPKPLFFLRRWLHITFGFFLESLKTQINFRKKNFYQQITFISRWTWKIWFSRQNLDCNLTQ